MGIRQESIAVIGKQNQYKIVFNKHELSKVFIWAAFYKVLLEIIYCGILSERWEYVGFTANRPSLVTYILSWVILLFVAFCLNQLMNENRFSSIVLQCLLILSFIPGVVMYTFREQSIFGFYCLYWLNLVASYLLFKPKRNNAVKLDINENILKLISVICFLFCFYVWARYAGFHLQLDLFDVYEQREVASNYNMPTIFTYLYGAIQVCVPFLAIWALNRKETKMYLILATTQMLAFFSQGSKASLFALIVGTIVHFIVDNNKKTSTIVVVKGMSFAGIACILEHAVLRNHFLVDYLYRRVLYLPNLLNIYYYDFFSNNEFDYYRSSILRFLGFQSPYSTMKIQNIIGSKYFNAPEMYTNNGLFSDAFANLGIVGLFVLPAFIIILLLLFDKCLGDADTDIKIGAAVYIVICLIGSSFFTNLFSHGFVLLAIMFCFLDKKNATIVRL